MPEAHIHLIVLNKAFSKELSFSYDTLLKMYYKRNIDMIQINDTIYIDPDTMNIYDKEFGHGEEALKQDDVNNFKNIIYDLDCNVPNSVMIFDYLTWYKKDDILNNLEIHIAKMKKIIT